MRMSRRRSGCLLVVLPVLIVDAAAAGAWLQTSPPTRTAMPGDLGAACQRVYAIAAKTPGVSIQRRTGTFRDEALPGPVVGCGLTISGSFARAKGGGHAAERLHEGLSALGWREMLAYQADGKDGTAFAFRDEAVACLVRGAWDGGSDQPATPPGDSYTVAVVCTKPAFAEERQR